jgi:hypothetical protein
MGIVLTGNGNPDCYMQNASEVNIKTILSFNARKEE